MEYNRTFKGEQGAGLEMKVKVECFTEENMREALSLIAQSSHKFYLDVAKVCKGEMEAAKPSQEETASNRPDFVREPNVKLKEEVAEFVAMSQEKFEEMVQNYLKSAPRCKFAEGNGSDSTSKSPASKQERLLAKLKKKLYKRADMEVEAARMISEGRTEDALRLLHHLDGNPIKKTLKKLI